MIIMGNVFFFPMYFSMYNASTLLWKFGTLNREILLFLKSCKSRLEVWAIRNFHGKYNLIVCVGNFPQSSGLHFESCFTMMYFFQLLKTNLALRICPRIPLICFTSIGLHTDASGGEVTGGGRWAPRGSTALLVTALLSLWAPGCGFL